MLPNAYRKVLALPRVRFTILLMFIARLPMTMMGIAMTLHVVIALGRGYGEAGLVGALTTIGGAIGAPMVGRMIDRHGLRRVVLVCGAASSAFWLTAAHLPYTVLAVLALPAGMLAVPANSLTRQFLTALTSDDQRRPLFTLDTILAELSFVGGPALVVLVTTQVSSVAAFTGIGVCIAATAAALWVTNLPIRIVHEAAPDRSAPRRAAWRHLDARLTANLLVVVGSLFTLVGTEIALVAALRSHGEAAWTGAVIAMMAIASIAGGIVYGAVRRSLSQATLAFLLGALLMPVGLFDHPWWLLGLALVPMNLMCTPTLAANAEAISKLAPADIRGEVMGLQETATRLGLALGAPVVGFVADHTSSNWAFVVAGLGGVLVAVPRFVVERTRRADNDAQPKIAESTASAPPSNA